MHTTLPFKKASSPGRSDREATPYWRVKGEMAAVVPDAAFLMSWSSASCAFAATAAAFPSVHSASWMPSCSCLRRPLRRSVVAVVSSNVRLVRAASAAAFREPSRASWPRHKPVASAPPSSGSSVLDGRPILVKVRADDPPS